MNKYKISLQEKGEDYPAYIIEVEGWNEEVAIFEAKKFLAENGWWPMCLSSIEERMKRITAVEVVEIDNGECQYAVPFLIYDKDHCMAYSQSKRSDDLHWAHYPYCEDRNCPLKHPELLRDGNVTAILE